MELHILQINLHDAEQQMIRLKKRRNNKYEPYMYTLNSVGNFRGQLGYKHLTHEIRGKLCQNKNLKTGD